MNNIYIGISNTLKGPQVPSVFHFSTRCDVFIDRYGKMYDKDNREILNFSDIPNTEMVYVYFMGIVRNDLSRTWTIQQYNILKAIFFHFGNPHLIFSDDYRKISKIGNFSF